MGNLFDDVINQNTTTAKKKSASKKQNPKIELEGELAQNLKKVISDKQELTIIKTDLDSQAAPVLETCQERQDEDGFAGNFSGSYDIAGVDGDTLKYVSADSFTVPQDEENKEALKKLLKNKFDKVFEETSNVVLKGEVFTDKKLQKEFLEIVGKDNFSKFFLNVKTLKAKKGLKEEVYNLFNEKKLSEFRALVSQKTASLKA